MGVGNPNFKSSNPPGKITQFSAGNQPDTNGRPPGVKNRSTIARKILEMAAIMPDDMFAELKANFPDIEQRMTTEEIATIAMLGAAIGKKDVNAYKAIMDSAYGAPKQETTIQGNIGLSDEPIIFK